MPRSAGDEGGVDDIDVVEARGEQTLQGGGGEQPRIERAGLAFVGNGDAVDAARCDLSGEAADLLGKGQIGPELRHVLRRDRGRVDRVQNRAGQQVLGHLLRDLDRDVLLRLDRGGAEVRRRDHLVPGEERVVLLRGLLLEHVERGTCHMAALDGAHQGRLHDQPAPRAVHDADAGPGPGQRIGVDDPPRLVRERDVQGDDVGLAEQLVHRRQCHAEGGGAVRREVGVEGDDPHLEPLGKGRDDGADGAAADDSERLVAQLHTHEATALPAALAGGAVGLRDAPRQRAHHRDGVLGGGHGIAVGRVHDHDAALGRGVYVDIVDAGARAAHDLEPARLRQQIRGHLGRGANHEALVVSDDLGQCLGREARLHADLDAALGERLHGDLAHLICDQDSRHCLRIPAGRISPLPAGAPRPRPNRATVSALRDRRVAPCRRSRCEAPAGRPGGS